MINKWENEALNEIHNTYDSLSEFVPKIDHCSLDPESGKCKIK